MGYLLKNGGRLHRHNTSHPKLYLVFFNCMSFDETVLASSFEMIRDHTNMKSLYLEIKAFVNGIDGLVQQRKTLTLEGIFHRATKLLIEEQWRGLPSPDQNFYPSTKLIYARPISSSFGGFIRRRMRDFSAHQDLELLAQIR